MRIELPINDGDDAAFVRYVDRLLTRAVMAAQPEKVYIVRLDNWFGSRWYGFHGKILGAVGFHNKRGYKRFIVPPFVPERVLSETCYERAGGEYVPIEVPERLAIHQKGGDNLKRWLDLFTTSGLLIWYSGNSASRDNASAMLYVNTPNATDAWYCGVRRDDGRWRFQKGIGITKREFDEGEPANTAYVATPPRTPPACTARPGDG